MSGLNRVDQITKDVAAEEGAAVITALQGQQKGDRSRAFGLGEAFAIAGFLVQCAQLTVDLLQEKTDEYAIVAALLNDEELMRSYPSLDLDKRMELVGQVLGKAIPDKFGVAAIETTSKKIPERQAWLKSFLSARLGKRGLTSHDWTDANTRDFVGGATILLPFADQDWWVVYTAIGWVPGSDDGPGVVRVDVPKGFVTDLTSIPRFLWSVLNKTGLYGNAAIFHDWLYWEQSCPRDVADRVFDRAMSDMGVDAATRRVIWSSVRVFGARAWRANMRARSSGEKRVLKEFPQSPKITWKEWRTRPEVFL